MYLIWKYLMYLSTFLKKWVLDQYLYLVYIWGTWCTWVLGQLYLTPTLHHTIPHYNTTQHIIRNSTHLMVHHQTPPSSSHPTAQYKTLHNNTTRRNTPQQGTCNTHTAHIYTSCQTTTHKNIPHSPTPQHTAPQHHNLAHPTTFVPHAHNVHHTTAIQNITPHHNSRQSDDIHIISYEI